MTTTDPQPDLSHPDDASGDLVPEKDYGPGPHFTELDYDAYGALTAEEKDIARVINDAVRKDRANPMINGVPLETYMRKEVQPIVSDESYDFLMTTKPLRRKIGADEIYDELDWADEMKRDNKMDGAGFTAAEVSGRSPRRYAKVGSSAVHRTPKRKPQGSVTPILESQDPNYPQHISPWSDENLAKLREVFPPRMTLLQRRLEESEDRRLARMTGRQTPESAARRVIGMEEPTSEEVSIEPWTEDDKRNLQWVYARDKFYPKDKDELKLVLSLIEPHNHGQIPVWQHLDSLTNMVVDPSKEAQRQLILKDVKKFVDLLDGAVMGVRYGDDLLAYIKELEGFGLPQKPTFVDLFPPEDIERDMLRADELVRVASYHEARMIAEGTPVREPEDTETPAEYAVRVLGGTTPRTFKALLVEYSESEMKKLEYSRERLEEAKIHAYVRDEVLAKLDLAEGQILGLTK